MQIGVFTITFEKNIGLEKKKIWLSTLHEKKRSYWGGLLGVEEGVLLLLKSVFPPCPPPPP